MKERPSHSHLQNRILLYMEYYKVGTLAGLARELDAHRSSVSRAMHALQGIGLVSKAEGCWSLTPAGEEEMQRVRSQLPERAAKAAETVNRLIDQGRLANLASDANTLYLASPLSAVSEAAKLTLSAAAQDSMQALISSVASIDSLALAHKAAQPLMEAAARVDLLASTQEAMQSLASVVTGIDSMALAGGASQPLVNTAASVDLIASAQEAMQSVASVAAKVDSSALAQKAIQPLVRAAAGFDSLVSAQQAVQPLMDAVERFDSLALAQEPSVNLAAGGDSFTSVQEAIQPLVNAAARFDSLALTDESMQTLIGVAEGVNFPALAREHQGVLNGVTAEFLAGASVLDVMNSAPLTSALDSVKCFSLKPTLAEIAASQALQTMGDHTVSIVADLGADLAQEALASFSQSQRLSSASIEQVSDLGDLASSIIREFSEANLGLSDIVSNVGAITIQVPDITSNVVPQLLNLAEVARTYRGYLADVVGGLGERLTSDRVDVGIAVPTRTTSAYVGSVKTAIVIDEADREDDASSKEFRIPWQDRAAQLDDVFQSLGPNFTAMWRGSWVVLDSDSPDRIRQAAHSGRELLMQVLAELAPDSAFDAGEIEEFGYHGRVTRRMRVKRILEGGSESTISWADAVVKALEETYGSLVAVSHDRGAHPQAREQQVAGLLHTLGGLLSFIDAFRQKHISES
jgi:DNA-binding MarR family transcriptional regulator